MRKVIMFNRVSVDGYFAGPNGEIDWFIPDSEVDQAVHEMMAPDTLLLGRITYQMFESYWPHVAENPNASKGDRVMADELNQLNKVVFSSTMKETTWVNSKVISGGVPETIKKLRQENGADITIFGSGTIVGQLTDEELIDEYLILVTPIILGRGKRLFSDFKKHNLNLIKARNFSSGNVLLHFKKGITPG